MEPTRLFGGDFTPARSPHCPEIVRDAAGSRRLPLVPVDIWTDALPPAAGYMGGRRFVGAG